MIRNNLLIASCCVDNGENKFSRNIRYSPLFEISIHDIGYAYINRNLCCIWCRSNQSSSWAGSSTSGLAIGAFLDATNDGDIQVVVDTYTRESASPHDIPLIYVSIVVPVYKV